MTDQYFMEKALEQVKMVYEVDEVPIGAVLVCDQRVIGRGHNRTEQLYDSTAHAEMIALSAGFEYLSAMYLEGCTLYVTLEPCVMCAGAMKWAQLGRIVYGAADDKNGFMKFSRKILHPKTILEYGLMEEESSLLLKSFFKDKRHI